MRAFRCREGRQRRILFERCHVSGGSTGGGEGDTMVLQRLAAPGRLYLAQPPAYAACCYAGS